MDLLQKIIGVFFCYFNRSRYAVYVVSPPKQHYQDIKTALEYKKHILCESPITVSKSECTELRHM